MARSMWSGSLGFGLVNIPIKMFAAVREQSISFHLLHDQDHARLKQKMFCTLEDVEVPREHIVRGYEVAPEQYVIVQDSDLEDLAPKGSRMIEISDFVDLGDIDPVYFDRAYYLAPDKNAAKPYQLLVEAMTKSKKVGVAKFVMRNKEYLAALRPVDGVICLETMHFADEVTPAAEFMPAAGDVKVSDRELEVAQRLIDSLATKFDPAEYHDEYRARVEDMLKKKGAGEEVKMPAVIKQRSTRASDLLSALEASLMQGGAKVKRQVPAATPGAPHQRAAEKPREPSARRRSPETSKGASSAGGRGGHGRKKKS